MSDDKDYKFINEKIVPKKMHPVKKFLLGFIAVLILGLVFGVVERIVFEMTGEVLPNFGIFKKNDSVELGKKDIASTGAVIASENSIKEVKEKNPVKEDKQVKIIEKRVFADLTDYRQVLNKFGELANKQNEAVV